MHASFSLPTEPGTRFAFDLARGLRERPKRVSPKYFYDEAGSALFDAICDLDEYYLTRTELAILHTELGALVEGVGSHLRVVELGSGSGNKTRALLDALDRPSEYLAVDVSIAPLETSARALRQSYPALRVIPVCADFTTPFSLPQSRAHGTLVYFPGSTIGNLPPSEAIELLRRVRQACGKCMMIVGVDLKKDAARLHAAYNDRNGVTAAFNKNVLARANREIGADFDLDAFSHYAFYSPVRGRIEMHLISSKEQRVHFSNERFDFAPGETLLTEYSYKYTRQELEGIGASGGFRVAVWKTDPRGDFAVTLLQSSA